MTNPYQPNSVLNGEAAVSTGSYFSDGLRMGPDFTDGVKPSTIGFGKNISAQEAYILSSAQNGKGIPVSYNTTYCLSAYPGPEYTFLTADTNPATNYDIALIPPGYPAGTNVPVTIGPATVTAVNGGSAWYVANPSGNYVQFDAPRAISIIVAGGDLASPFEVTIQGRDVNGIPMTATYGESTESGTPDTGTIQDAGAYSAASSATFDNANLYQTNRAFYQITGVTYTSASAIPVGVYVCICTSFMFGFPYFFNVVVTPVNSFYANSVNQFAGQGANADLPIILCQGPTSVAVPYTIPATVISGCNVPLLNGFYGDPRGTFCPVGTTADPFTLPDPFQMIITWPALGSNQQLNVAASQNKLNYLLGVQGNSSLSQTNVSIENSIGYPQYADSQ